MVTIKHSRPGVVLAASLAALFLLVVLGCSWIDVTTYYQQGAVATGAPIATDLAIEVLKKGGNAFDAAVATGFVLAVVHPSAGNIGGGGFAVIRNGADGRVRTLDFRETAPLAAVETMYLNDDGEVIDSLSLYGARACGVPGTVAGLHALWQEYGSMKWEELVKIAANVADTGFIVDDFLAASLTEYHRELTLYEETADIFVPNGQKSVAGDRFLQLDLARTLYAIAAEGPDGFYSGEVAEKIVATMQKYNGLITAEDLASYLPVWREPTHITFDGYDIYSMPLPSSGGVIVAQILKLLEPYDFARLFPESVDYIHLFCEASRLAFADRSEHLGDPAFYAAPSTLLDAGYLDARRKLIDPQHATPSTRVKPGSPPIRESEQTTHYSICDDDGNMVAITYTLNTGYGSSLVVGGAGFLLNNEMDDFSIKPGVPNVFGLIGGEANKIEPGKRMLSSMSPTLVLKDDKPRMILGTPGGSKIITVVAQTLLNSIRFDMSAEALCAQPRFHHQWLPDMLYLEEGQFDINIIQGLIRYGHSVKERKPYSDLQVIELDENGMMTATSDPRNRGKASGY